MEGSEDYTLSVARVGGIAAGLLDRLEQAVRELDAVVATKREKVKTETGEQVTEYEQRVPRKKGTVDRAGLKQLTGVLKDLEEILLCCPQLDVREQTARIRRLERELEAADSGGVLTVVLEGEAESYGD